MILTFLCNFQEEAVVAAAVVAIPWAVVAAEEVCFTFAENFA